MIAAEVETSAFRNYPMATGLVDQTPMEEWCSEMIGAQAQFRDHVSDEYPWTYSFMGGKTIWHFAKEEYATMFRLRWL
jgi:hypothetical protein